MSKPSGSQQQQQQSTLHSSTPHAKPTELLTTTPVDLTSLSVDNLVAVKKQLEDELEHLSTSFSELRQDQTRFRECIKSVKGGIIESIFGNTLSVPRELSDAARVLVDVGTGDYVEKTTADAVKFYEAKVEELSRNMADLERIVAQKGQYVRVVEEVLRQKVMARGAASA